MSTQVLAATVFDMVTPGENRDDLNKRLYSEGVFKAFSFNGKIWLVRPKYALETPWNVLQFGMRISDENP